MSLSLLLNIEGVEIEEPFSIMPLLPLCKKITQDAKLAMEMPHLDSQTLLIYDSI